MEKARKGLIIKTWERCRSMGQGRKQPAVAGSTLSSVPRTMSARPDRRHRVVPEGCLCVRVGPGKERFLIKMECVNHPLFRMLLEEAETEYGYANEGPLSLPCEVDHFQRLLWEIEQDDTTRPGCSCARGYGGYQLLSPRRTPMVYRAQPC